MKKNSPKTLEPNISTVGPSAGSVFGSCGIQAAGPCSTRHFYSVLHIQYCPQTCVQMYLKTMYGEIYVRSLASTQRIESASASCRDLRVSRFYQKTGLCMDLGQLGVS